MTGVRTAGAPGESRLTRMIARLTAQRACLERAAELIRDLEGPVLEVGLGKGRTYNHLCRILPGREIFVFDRDVHAPADSVPDAAHLVLGDVRQTLADRARAAGPGAALIHADIGTEDPAADVALMAEVAPLLAALIRPGGVLVADRAAVGAGWRPLALPDYAGGWIYYMYRVADGVAA